MSIQSREDLDSPWWRYGIAIASSLFFLLLKLGLRRYLGDAVPFVLFFSAVMISAWFGGMGPGILSTLLCTAFAGLYFMGLQSNVWAKIWPLVTFSIEGLTISLLSDSRRRVLWDRTLLLQRERASREQAEQVGKQLNTALENINVEMAQRKHSEDSLRASEERRRLALDSAELGEWHIDPSNMLLTADQRFRDIFGITTEDIDYAEAFELVHPEDRVRVTEQLAEAWQPDNPQPFSCEYRIIRPDGSIHWVFARGRANIVQGESQPWIVTFDGTVADITERKASENLASTILESITDAFFAVNRDWRFNYVNPQAEHMLDRKPGDLLGKLLWEEYPGLVGSEFEKVYLAAMNDRVPGSLTSFYPDHDRWYEVRVYPSPDGISIYFQDVSDSKRAEEEHLRLSSEVQRQARIFDTTLSSITDFAYILDRDSRFRYVNKALLDLWGLPLEQAIGKDFFDLKYPDELAAKLAAQVRQVFETKKVLSDETPYTSPTGVIGYYEYIFAPVFAADGSVELIAGSTRDVSERKRIEAELRGVVAERESLLSSERSARGEAERASRMKDEFLATLSHELRTPLNAILGWSQILSGENRGQDDLAEGLAAIERNARSQTQIIEDLLDMSRIISGKVRFDVQRVDLVSVVRAAVDTLQPAASAKGIRLHAVLDPNAGPISGDPNRLQQVFWNLLNNSIKFTPRGGRVQVLLQRIDSHLEINVIDTGEGIKPEFLPFMFDRFRQSDASTTRRHGGLGLGLAIVKQLVELHGGTVRAKSPGEGQGATFTVSLPLTVIHSEPDLPQERVHPTLKTGIPIPLDQCADLAGIKVLVLDDEPDARALVKRFLEDCNAIAILAPSSEEAVEKVRTERPDVIASDIGMPEEDGYTFIRRVRALSPDQGGNTPALALTAYARSEDRIKAITAGFQCHISKPVEPAELIAMIASLAGRNRDT